jgi:hypothetical protein
MTRLPFRPHSLFLPAAILFASALPARAQVTPPPVRDTVVVDTMAPPPDSVKPPARRYPIMPLGPAANHALGVWVWDREALLREAPLSLTELLARLPAVEGFRAGMFVQPEAASAFGGTAGRLLVELDGWPLDPVAASTIDLSTIPLGMLREVRVERRLGLLRIQLFTDYPEEGQPYTRIEAGVGQPDANLFRGLFLVPDVIAGPLGIGVERLDTDGLGGSEPASVFNGWGKLSWTNERMGVQAEIIRSTLKREPNSPWPVDRVRQDLVIRARNAFMPSLVGELYAGRTWLDQEPFEATDADSTIIDRDVTQAGARLAWQTELLGVGGAFRFRDLDALPRTEVTGWGSLDLGPAFASGEVNSASWQSGESATSFHLHGQLAAPFGGSVFAELTGGSRGAPDYDAAGAVPILTERDGWRVGAALSLGQRASGSVALVNLDQDRAHPFGLPFDSLAGFTTIEPARGIEAMGRLVIIPGWIAVESWITNWSESAGWTYLPARTWRTALELHALPLPSGNLEILGRLEGVHRSGMLAYNPDAAPDPPGDYSPLMPVPGYTQIHGYLQIRIIDVRIFLRYEDLTNADIEEVPGRFHRGPRLMYGVKWNLWN